VKHFLQVSQLQERRPDGFIYDEHGERLGRTDVGGAGPEEDLNVESIERGSLPSARDGAVAGLAAMLGGLKGTEDDNYDDIHANDGDGASKDATAELDAGDDDGDGSQDMSASLQVRTVLS
jgi:hypothetical protein